MDEWGWINVKYGFSIRDYYIVFYSFNLLFFSCLGQTTWLNTQLMATSVALNSISGLLCRSTTCGVMSREWKGACTTKLYSIPNIQQYNTKRSSNYFKFVQTSHHQDGCRTWMEEATKRLSWLLPINLNIAEYLSSGIPRHTTRNRVGMWTCLCLRRIVLQTKCSIQRVANHLMRVVSGAGHVPTVSATIITCLDVSNISNASCRLRLSPVVSASK